MSTSTTTFGLQKLPARYAGIVMPRLLSMLMTMIVSFVSTALAVGFPPGFLRIWAGARAMSLIFAFPTPLLLLPVVRRASAVVRGGSPHGGYRPGPTDVEYAGRLAIRGDC